MAVSRAIAAEADTVVVVMRQRAQARGLVLERARWHVPHDPTDRTIEFALMSNGQPYTFAFPLTDLLLLSRGHHPRGETREQRVEAFLDRIVQPPDRAVCSPGEGREHFSQTHGEKNSDR
jgi:hypothetical protein